MSGKPKRAVSTALGEVRAVPAEVLLTSGEVCAVFGALISVPSGGFKFLAFLLERQLRR